MAPVERYISAADDMGAIVRWFESWGYRVVAISGAVLYGRPNEPLRLAVNGDILRVTAQGIRVVT